MLVGDSKKTASSRLVEALELETEKFESCYSWLESAMSEAFFEEVPQENIMLITHSLMDFHLQDFFSVINLKNASIAICLNTPDADLRILKRFSQDGIKRYRAFVSRTPPPYRDLTHNLRIVMISFTEAAMEEIEEYAKNEESWKVIHDQVIEHNPDQDDEELHKLYQKIDPAFMASLNDQQKTVAMDLLVRARNSDHCQYEVRYLENWNEADKQKEGTSMQIILAWRNTPKYHFLYRLARTVNNHNLVMRRVNATYMDPFSKNNVLLMVLGLHGVGGKAAWDAASTPDFLRDMVTLKYFSSFDDINDKLFAPGLVSRLMSNFLRSVVTFTHQALVNIDSHKFSIDHIEEDLCRHPELTIKLCEAFEYKFHPMNSNFEKYSQLHSELQREINTLDTGHEDNDKRRRQVLTQGLNFIEYTLKTNLYRPNYTALSFRLDPNYLDKIPFNRLEKYPELPYAIFLVKGLDFFGFHIRFRDLARGGVRTIFPDQVEHIISESNNVFNECYNLALTQHKKNKDIPEGGAKGIIFIKSFDRLEAEARILEKELRIANTHPDTIKAKSEAFRKLQIAECFHLAQRSYIESIMTLINCHEDGSLKAENIVDYWKKPEYLYLGPDENMRDNMIQWIADYSKKAGYKPGTSFITSKPQTGLNHKRHGVTSLGVNVFMEEVLKHLGINPKTQKFSVKMSGGPDGDVAGNQILNLRDNYPETAKLIALTDASGTIYDPAGLDLFTLGDLFREGKPIRFYPPKQLSEEGFLVDKHTTQNPSALVKKTLCWRREREKILQSWLSGSQLNNLIRNNIHSTYADVFIPAGGRPRTLNENNWTDYLDKKGKPTSKAIVEGANLYLTEIARRKLEEEGVLIIRDSSANKCGVICSSFEVLTGLTISDHEFIQHRDVIVDEIKENLRQYALDEARLLLKTHKETGAFLTETSEKISETINKYTTQLLNYLEEVELSNDPTDPLISCFLSFCLPILRTHYHDRLMENIPDNHKKSIIACHIASQLVYHKGIEWQPSIVDVLPTIWSTKK